jgi:hypothetical protein
MAQEPKKEFVFRKHMVIGEVDAENDSKFLQNCFVDTGDFEILEDTTASQSIVLGRTGAGKSALLERLEATSEHVIRIEPEELALKHISNSNILKFFEDIGVNLDIFYSLLWQHTLAVELIKHKYKIDSPQSKKSFLDKLASMIGGNAKKKQALQYIEDWGDKFWLDTETRIKEFTDKLEKSLSSGTSSGISPINFSIDAKSQLSSEQISEVIHYGKKVVNSVQIEKLAKIINLLSEDIFNDPQVKTYIVIDRLDEGWVEDNLRYKLIRALIETIRKFRKIETVKVIMTLRIDLLDRVLESTRDSGFQREKYNSLFLNLGWTKENLKSVLDSRINMLLKHKYTSTEVYFNDIFPNRIDKSLPEDYILDRTLLRPRDAIVFVNECLSEAQGRSIISGSIVQAAEKQYSIGRLESLQYEWFVEHPNLTKYIDIFNNKPPRIKVSDISREDVERLTLEIIEKKYDYEDTVVTCAREYYNSSYPQNITIQSNLVNNLVYVLYKVGVIGVKVDGTSPVSWISNKTQDLTVSKIKSSSILYIHRMLWRALAIDKSR